MSAKWVKAAAATAVAAGLFGLAGSASARPVELTGVDANGNVVSSGWTYDVADALAGAVNLEFIRVEGNRFYFEKDATITNISDPIVIDFAPVAGAATVSTLVINDEAVKNNTGQDWTGFRMTLSSGNVNGTPNFGFQVLADGTGDVTDASNINISPFTTFTFAESNTELLLGGGTVAAGETYFFGAQSRAGLGIVAAGGAAAGAGFTLKEFGLGGQGPAPIPLPAAAWTGLSGLVGLGLIGGVRKIRKTLA